MVVEQFERTHTQTRLCLSCDSSIETDTQSVPLSLVHSPALPTDHEALSIQHSISSDIDALRGLDRQICQLEGIIRALCIHRDDVRSNVDRKRALLSPIRCLPPEIMGIIIDFAITSTFRRKRDSSLVKQHPVLQVCRRWRELAISMPRLWTNIVLYPCADRGWNDTLALCIERSSSHPLHLVLHRGRPSWHTTIVMKDYYIHLPDLEWKRACVSLVGAAHRWRSMRLELLDAPSWLLDRTPFFSQLKGLDLRRFGLSLRGDNQLFRDCPALDSLRLESLDVHNMRLPWSQLRRLEIHSSPDITSFVTALSQCPGLESLILSMDFQGVFGPVPINLPALQSLTMRKSSYCALAFLIMPNLLDLRLEPSAEDAAEYELLARLYIAALLAHCDVNNRFSQSLVTTLLLPAAPGTDWHTLWSKFPRITHLTVTDDLMDNNLRTVEVINSLANRTDCLPSLARLDLPSFFVDEEAKAEALEALFDGRALEVVVYETEYHGRLSNHAQSRGGSIREGAVPTLGSEDEDSDEDDGPYSSDSEMGEDESGLMAVEADV
ncbi:uncharacterized protein SCHCODRAFT_02682742 [Schizophyllum commune H4-8]|uniref:uncharacterized protein n=1 Tax=Schizophyllum commune (strain H4-8 / FGSC 9210) TaxID=578458 RepID=UPI002160F953|nr:uncharacterized protein SCHCODRAFT_02682742 [Schizophyllum commune H4-8]KAI5899778.1 hypothetical protein SCHCODRAFT_02682742 [Schizophyllum commune H4-8]